KVLMVGLGGIGQRHLRNLRTLLGDDAEVIAVRARGLRHVLTDRLTVEPDADLEARYGVETVRDLDTALARRPELVFVTNPSRLHVPVALAAAGAGSHLFIEKPLSDDLDDVDRLIDIVDRRRVTGLVGYQLRFHPALIMVKQLLEREAVGAVLAARFEVGE